MNSRYAFLLSSAILAAATDPTDGAASSGGGESAPDPAASAPVADESKLTIGQRMNAAIASKADLKAKIAERDSTITEHAATIERMTQENATLTTQLAEANARITALETEAAEVDQALQNAEAEAVAEKAKNATVDQKAQEKVAALGFPASKLPAAQEQSASDDDVPSTRAELEAKMDTLKTGQERIDLLRAYQKAQKAQSSN